MTTTTITPTTSPTGEARLLVTVEFRDGSTDTIEAADFPAAIRFSHMHLAAIDYGRRHRITV